MADVIPEIPGVPAKQQKLAVYIIIALFIYFWLKRGKKLALVPVNGGTGTVTIPNQGPANPLLYPPVGAGGNAGTGGGGGFTAQDGVNIGVAGVGLIASIINASGGAAGGGSSPFQGIDGSSGQSGGYDGGYGDPGYSDGGDYWNSTPPDWQDPSGSTYGSGGEILDPYAGW